MFKYKVFLLTVLSPVMLILYLSSYVLINDPFVASEYREFTAEKNLIVRTRADEYPFFSDERYAATDNCGAQIVTTDYPPRTVREKQHTYTFNGYMFKLLK